MKNGTKNIIAACIIAVGLIAVSYTYVEMNRYYFLNEGSRIIRTDKWTGEILVHPI